MHDLFKAGLAFRDVRRCPNIDTRYGFQSSSFLGSDRASQTDGLSPDKRFREETPRKTGSGHQKDDVVVARVRPSFWPCVLEYCFCAPVTSREVSPSYRLIIRPAAMRGLVTCPKGHPPSHGVTSKHKPS